jgi:hypothetical protein
MTELTMTRWAEVSRPIYAARLSTCSNTGCRQRLAHGALARVGPVPPLGVDRRSHSSSSLPSPTTTTGPPPAGGPTGALPAPAAETGGAAWWRTEGTRLSARVRVCCGEDGGTAGQGAGCGGGGLPGVRLKVPHRRRPPRFAVGFCG